MAENILDVKLKQRYDTEANWTSVNPVLLKGEIAISSDKDGKYKVGDGSSKWSALPYAYQSSLDAKQATIIGAATTIASSNLTANRALISNSSGKVAISAVTDTELGYLDGVTSNIQTQLNSKSTTGHTHNYAGSSSAGGIANSANKLATARTVTVSGDMTGSFIFDGSQNVACNIYPYYATISVGNTNNYSYHRFAKLDTIVTTYQDRSSIFLITQDYDKGGFGIVKVTLRTNSGTTVSSASVEWLVRKDLDTDSVQVGLYNVFGSTYADVFFKTKGTYNGTVVRNIASGTRGNVGRTWTLVNSSEAHDTTTSDAKTSKECFSSITSAGTLLHNQAYSTTVVGVDSSTVKTAYSASTLATARTINGTSFNGSVNITTANWGTARNVSIASSDGSGAGSATSVNGSANVTLKLPATIKATLTGNASTATSSTKATQDSEGQQINTTYIKAITTSGKNLTYTKGNGSTSTVNTQSNLITCTKAAYDALVSSGTVNEDNYYFSFYL